MDANFTVMTLDAGGTNFVFSAVKNAEEITTPVTLPAEPHDLEKCLKSIIKGFENIETQLHDKPDAISFAFPGPADYLNGIIGDLGNLPAFRGGVALGPLLKHRFGIPVFINNDGDLFTYGESKYGLLPKLNKFLISKGSSKQFNNLAGITLGTGLGGGIARGNNLFLGDNGAAGEIWLLRNPLINNSFAEESVSARAVVREYVKHGGTASQNIQPMDIYKIAHGNAEGNKNAALESFKIFGRALGSILTEISTIIDGIIVIGGGLSNAWDLFQEEMFKTMNGSYTNGDNKISRLVMQVYNLENEQSLAEFASGKTVEIDVPFTNQKVSYDPNKRIGVGRSRLGTSNAVSLGAYAFAYNAIKNEWH